MNREPVERNQAALDAGEDGIGNSTPIFSEEEYRIGEQGVQFHPAWNGKRECFLLRECGVPVIKFRAFEALSFMEHGFSTRLGGVSEGEFASLNLSYNRGDAPERVDENYRRILETLHMQGGQLVLSDQVHETAVAYVDGTVSKVKETDGLMTDRPGVVLATSYADCVPLFFADPVRRAIASSHSGWRGTAAGMGRITVEAMAERFGSDPNDMICVIGPSICRDCYEVGHELKEAFAANFTEQELSEIFLCREEKGPFPAKKENDRLDLWSANRMILRKAGVRDENIHTAGICTCCNARLLYSHRASGGHRGNLNGFLMIRESL